MLGVLLYVRDWESDSVMIRVWGGDVVWVGDILREGLGLELWSVLGL